jgi:hypothetical protein
MADEIKSNLEPNEESDLNLKEKFIGGVGTSEKAPEKKIQSIEGNIERTEGAAEKEAAYSKILSKLPASGAKIPADPGQNVANDASIANAAMDAETKIQNLVKIAEVKGIPHAVKVARHMEDNYTLDEFHDRMLGEELHDALVEKGMIKEI